MMDYLVTYTYGTLRFYASDIFLTIDSDSAYLVLTKSCSLNTACYIFGQDPATVTNPMTNAPFHFMCNTIKNVMDSAAKSETGGIFMGGQR